MTTEAMAFTDLERLAEVEAPDLADAIYMFLRQGEPSPEEMLPPDAITLAGLRAMLQVAAKQFGKTQRQSQAHEAWKRYLSQPDSLLAPQMRLADLVVSLYQKGTPSARAALVLLASEAPLVFGLWGGLKRVFKLAERDLDAEIFSALAVRFDVEASSYGKTGDVGKGTLVYLARRAARFLRLLGKGSPELYPQFAVEVLRRYPADIHVSFVASHIFTHTSVKWGAPGKNAKKFRATYLESWKRSADPLMLLLETCQSDLPARFAIDGLRELFPEVLRKVSPEWLGRLSLRPLPSAHEFLVETLEGSPEFHQSKLAPLGLKEAVLRLLLSPSPKARKYAIEYARAHATDLSIERIVALLDRAASFSDTSQFLVSVLIAKPARTLGLPMLGRLLRFHGSNAWAAAAIERDFEKKEISPDFLFELLLDEGGPRAWAVDYIKKKLGPTELDVSFWLRVLDDERLSAAWAPRGSRGSSSQQMRSFGLQHLVRYPLTSVPGEWLLSALGRSELEQDISRWLEKADQLPASLDVERLRGLVFDPSKRQVAFTLLGNPKLVPPRQVGLPWLLALARRADPALHEWAHHYLLEHVTPFDFAEGKADLEAGVAKVFDLASGPKQPEAIRIFAQLYLRAHHPVLGKHEPDAQRHGVKPAIPRESYSLERTWPCLFDARADVRRFGVAITRVELRRWGAQLRVYELAESSAKEVRGIAYDALAEAGEADADPELALQLNELDAAQIFSMTESRKRSTRDIAMDLIRKHYARLGGAERLGWLMQSADREVRLFAVRLLWERHRPRGIPAEWRPAPDRPLTSSQPFRDAEVLRALLRRLLFMVPPGRSMEQLDRARANKLSASVAKRHVIEIVRDLAVDDAEFANVVAPVFAEFTGSVAKGEWQACLAALMRLRAVHGIALPDEGVSP